MPRPPRTLIWVTSIVLVLIGAFGFFFLEPPLPPAIEIDTAGQPTIGYPRAKVHVVVFEEPKCPHCKEYNTEIYPQIKKEFIDTNKILYTVIPVSFLPGSMPAAIALLCVYNQDEAYPNDDLFFKYLDYIFAHQPAERDDWATPEKLIEFAEKASPAIKTDRLKPCIDTETHRIKIDQNTEYGTKIMHGRLITPTLYVNGIEVKELSFDQVSDLIKKALQHEGVSNH